jgi:hypothetical protein
MLTPSQRDTLLSQLRSHYNGVKVDYWGYPGECVSYVRRWLDVIINGTLNGPMVSPPAPGGADGYGAYYWSQPTDAIRNLFDVLNYDPNATYPAGSLFVNTGSGHVGIMLDNQPGQPNALVSEQNADPDGSPVGDKQRGKARINGILVLKLAPEAPPAPLYTITEFSSPKQVQVTPGHYKWNLGQPDFKSVEANPIELSTADTHFNAVAILHHRNIPQYNYYLEDANTPHGWNVLDCMDYTPPPAPYVPPAAPVSAPLAEKYTLVTNVMTFNSASEAIKHSGVAGALVAGDYFVMAKRDKAYNLSNDNMKDKNQWVNIADNVIDTPSPTLPVDPPPVVTTPVDVAPPPVLAEQGSVPKPLFYDWIDGVNHQPVWFHTLNTTEQRFKDLENPDGPQALLPPNKDVRFSMVTIKGGINWYVPTLSLNSGGRHAVPETLLRRETPVESFLDEAESDLSDWTRKLAETPQKVYTLIADISPVARRKVASQAKQIIDGFKSKSGSKK